MTFCTYINAKYIGACDLISNMYDDDIALNVGDSYSIQICQKWWGFSFKVTPCHGYDMKPMADMTIKYPSLEHVFRDWQPLELLRNPDIPYFVNTKKFDQGGTDEQK